jgi:hypothetical protein
VPCSPIRETLRFGDTVDGQPTRTSRRRRQT